MPRLRLVAALALAAAATVQTTPAAVAADDAPPRVLAEYPAGAFLENLSVAPDGAVLVTSYFARAIERIGPDDAATTFAALPDHPVSILPLGAGWLVAVHGAAFTEGPGFVETQGFLVLDAAGAVLRRIPAPQARFLNGMAALDDGTVLAADSIAGVIWRLDPATGALAPWLADPRLALPEGFAGFAPGANGLKIADGRLHVSNSARGALYRLPLGADGAPAGPLETVAEPGGIDDFWIEPDGTVVLATHGDALLRIAPDGARTELLSEGCDACTAVAPRDGPAGREWIVLTTGGFLEGRGAPARILALPAVP
jgi:hypothetical protein